ncbi:putative alcohol dehydrogenase [Durotheca rogersii]|uniref:putative alcohol dehydrogenase n=1 Tax=Durotheca rogersii TaxID=419775 RepID=UPI00221F8264|nr:putative alcohol dehydrogenase [Durotheca rogersii]KAI5860474.1 putative alcohol dehydrogenase [Durotheca rogersii]
MSLPKTYRRAIFAAKGEPLTIEETPLTLPSAGELLVKVEACGVCFSDMFAQMGVMDGGFPLCPGHEIIGRVAAVGPTSGSLWKVGDRVGAGWHGGHDSDCAACQKGWFQMCENQAVNGETKHGGYGEYCLLRSEATVRVPEHVDAAKYAPILCAGMTVFNSLRHMNIPVGETVAVQGLGGLGHLAVQYAARMGYRVVAISRGADKEKFARELGAHAFIDASGPAADVGDALKALGGASLAIATAPTADSIAPLVKGLGVLGKLLVLSVPGDLTINTGVMLKNGLSVQSWPCGHARDSEEAIAFTELQHIDCMIQKFPLEQAQEAFEAMLAGTVRFRAVIVIE